MKPTFPIALILFCILLNCRVEAQKISLGPGVLTFPEIAENLSVHGKSVQCEVGLDQRAAFVFLKDRSWEDVTSLLCKGLQLRFFALKDNENVFVMKRDPDVVTRERRWVSLLAESYRTYVKEGLDLLAPYSVMNDDEARRAATQITNDISGLLSLQGGMDSRGAPGDGIDHIRHEVIVLNGILDFLRSSTRRVNFSWLTNSGVDVNEIENSILYGHTVHVTNIDGSQTAGLGNLLRLYTDHTPDVHLGNYNQLAGGWQFCCSDGDMNLSARLELLGRGKAPVRLRAERVMGGVPGLDIQNRSLIDTIFEGIRYERLPGFNGIGHESVNWLANERAQTSRYLETDRAKTGVVVKAGAGQLNSLSQIIGAWASGTDSEAIMELSPQQEFVSGHINRSAFQLSDLYDARNSVWSFSENNKVLLVTNRLAFLDRAANLPVASLIRFERAAGGKQTRWAVPLDDAGIRALSSYCNDVSTDLSSPWTATGNISNYRNVDTMLLDHSVGAMYLWGKLSVSEQDSLLKSAMNQAQVQEKATGNYAGSVTLPFEHFGSHDLARLLDLFKTAGFANIDCFGEGYFNSMWNSLLTIKLTRSADRPGWYTVYLRFYPYSDSDVMFLWKPK